MQLDEYTSDAVCRAMALPAFIEEAWTRADNPVLRVVLTPSFHPEICITMCRSNGETQLTVVALRQSLWVEGSWRALPSDRADFRLPATVFDEVVSLFETMRAAYDQNHLVAFCDGMGSDSCLVSRSGVGRLRTQVIKQFGVAAFIARALELTWQGCGQPRVANAVAQAARYVGLELPLNEFPVEPESTRLMVLGGEQDRNEYLEMLRKRKEALKRNAPHA